MNTPEGRCVNPGHAIGTACTEKVGQEALVGTQRDYLRYPAGLPFHKREKISRLARKSSRFILQIFSG